MYKLNPQQKIAFYKQLELGLSLGLTRVLDIFNDVISKISIEKEQEFKARIESMNKEIARLKLEVKDGYTPVKNKDYFDGQKGDKGDTPIKGKDYFTTQEILSFKKEITPKKNKDYFDGKDSVVPGPMGPKGEAGSPDKPFEIAKKLNTTKESVDVDVIKGLSKSLMRLEKAIREKGDRGGSKTGGGMGNWEHEVFNTSSSTTSVTLPHRVAGSGAAILVRYQGQLLAHGVQYTISNKTISFTFTLQDSTFVEVTYVRT